MIRTVNSSICIDWGLTKNVIDQLDRDEYDYKVQFDSYINSEQIKKILSKKNVARDGDYKIHLSDLHDGKARLLFARG